APTWPTLTAVWQRTQRRPTLGMLRGPAPPAECRMRCLPTSRGSTKGSEGRGSVRHSQHKVSATVLCLARPCIQDTAVGTSTSRTNNYRSNLAWRKCPKGQGHDPPGCCSLYRRHPVL